MVIIDATDRNVLWLEFEFATVVVDSFEARCCCTVLESGARIIMTNLKMYHTKLNMKLILLYPMDLELLLLYRLWHTSVDLLQKIKIASRQSK